MAKAKTAKRPKETATVTYLDGHGGEVKHTFDVPMKHGVAEHILNAAGRAGCRTIPALREQLAKHY